MVGPLKDLFHRNMKQSRGELPDYYTQKIERSVRLKILLHYRDYQSIPLEEWRQHCQREIDPSLYNMDYFNEFYLTCPDEDFLSTLQILLTLFLHRCKSYPEMSFKLNDFLSKINKIFQIERVGYEISIISNPSDTDVPILIVPFDSKYLHEETVQKTRALLNNFEFDGALNEFDDALDDLRFDKYEDCIHKLNKAYESTLKTILDKKGLSYEKGEKIFSLVTKVKSTLKLEDSLNTLFERVWPLLDQGPNVIRNFEGIGHGQGSKIKTYEKSYANFVLHITGTYIVFLLERYEEIK